MKILMVSNDFLPDNPGGVANHIANLSEALVRLGHQVMILHFSYALDEDRHDNHAGVPIHHVAVAKNLAFKRSLYAKVMRFFLTWWKGGAVLSKLIKRYHPDVVHWHDYYHSSLAIRRIHFKGKKVLTNHASGFLELYARQGWTRYYLKFLAKPADAMIGPSEELAEKSKVTGKPCYFIPNGVNLERFQPVADKGAARKYLGYAPDDLCIVAPRRLDPKNGLDVLIQAIPQVLHCEPKAQFVIAGGGDPRLQRHYETLAQTLNVGHRFSVTGYLEYHMMPQIIGIADIVVIPSYYEAVSLALLEAMACGVPVIVTDVGGMPSVVDDSVGLVVPAGDPKKLGEAILKLSRSSEQRQQKGLQARSKVAMLYSWQTIAQRTCEQVYQC